MSSRKVILVPGFDFENNDTVLGLDCSSKTVGWGLLTHQPLALVAHGYFNPLPSKHHFVARLNDMFEKVTALCSEFHPSSVAIEDIIQHMKRGMSSAQTITILAAFNRVAALAVWRSGVKDILFYPVSTIRKTIREGTGCKTKIDKEDVPSIVRANLCPNFSDVISKKGLVSYITMDEADGIAVGWAHMISRGQ
jgi:Holliday junction resolvasome RuvABC endonuclease subunit